MNVGELKRALADLPDDMPVVVDDYEILITATYARQRLAYESKIDDGHWVVSKELGNIEILVID